MDYFSYDADDTSPKLPTTSSPRAPPLCISNPNSKPRLGLVEYGFDYSKAGFTTRAIHQGQDPEPVSGAVATPLDVATTLAQYGAGQHTGYEYSRTGNPTRISLEKSLASLENAKYRSAFSSGSAATTTLMHLLNAGDHVVCIDDVYGATNKYFNKVAGRTNGLTSDFGDGTIAEVLDCLEEYSQLMEPQHKSVASSVPQATGYQQAFANQLSSRLKPNFGPDAVLPGLAHASNQPSGQQSGDLNTSSRTGRRQNPVDCTHRKNKAAVTNAREKRSAALGRKNTYLSKARKQSNNAEARRRFLKMALINAKAADLVFEQDLGCSCESIEREVELEISGFT